MLYRGHASSPDIQVIMQKVLLVIQARSGSTRLPNKVCMELVPGRSLLACLLTRLKQSQSVTQIVVATTDKPEDDPVAAIAKQEAIEVFRGSELDVLARFAGAAERFPGDYIVRICADSPIHDAEVVDLVVAEALAHPDAHYVSNMHPESFPYGMAVEVMTAPTLSMIAKQAVQPDHREHVTKYIADNPQFFKSHNVLHVRDLSAVRVVVDYPEDMDLARALYAKLSDRGIDFSWKDAVRLLEEEPELSRMNARWNDRRDSNLTAKQK